MKGCEVVEATVALYRLADAVLQKYDEAKARRAALDFEDLIARTKNLLATRSSAEWVLYKLDNGLDHLLVDESQDTSPEQWQVVSRLAEEFFAGGGAREEPRTIFAVGDEKQSIYSFQGAAPEKFAEMGGRFADLARDVQAPFHRVDLNVSFPHDCAGPRGRRYRICRRRAHTGRTRRAFRHPAYREAARAGRLG